MPGPAPDPQALRRDRPSDIAGWTTLPIEGYAGPIPDFPLRPISFYDIYWEDKKRIREFDADATEQFHDVELALWEILWRKPQAVQWVRLGLTFQVAAYVRAFLESNQAEASSGLKTAALRMEEGLGISVKGMNTLRWKISADEVGSRRAASAPKAKRASARERLKVLNAGGA